MHLPSRALIQESIYDRFMERCLERIGRIRQGNPLDLNTQMGPQNSSSSSKRSSLTSTSAWPKVQSC